MLHLDFETASPVDLEAAGLHNYAHHRETRVWCLAYQLPNEAEPCIWVIDGPKNATLDPYATDYHINRLNNAISSGVKISGWNIMFEWYIWNRVLLRSYPRLRPLPIKSLHCTMAAGLVMGLPAKLEKAGGVYAAKATPDEQHRYVKDSDGHKVMLKLSRPVSTEHGVCQWHQDPDMFRRLYMYCKQDVIVEVAISKQIRPLTAQLLDQWQWIQDVNLRGVHADTATATKLLPIVESATELLGKRIAAMTDGVVTKPTQHKRFLKWCQEKGAKISSVGKGTRGSLKAGELDVSDEVAELLELWGEASAGSVNKLQRVVDMSDANDRVYNAYQFHAAHTGRAGGRGVQLQNLRRPDKGWTQEKAIRLFDIAHKHDPETAAGLIQMCFGNPLPLIGGSIRAIFDAAPGKSLCTVDLSAIESVMLAWCAREEWKLQAHRDGFAKKTRGVYVELYAKSFGLDPSLVDDFMRQIGKVMDLAFGYEGYIGAWENMAKAYGVNLPGETVVKLWKAWRESHPATVRWWRALEEAAIRAVRFPRHAVACSPVTFYADKGFLACKLPSGRALYYLDPFVTVDHARNKAQFGYWGADGGAWTQHYMYGGAWAENLVQAMSYDVFMHGALRARDEGLDIVLHSHDELVAEADEDKAGDVEALLVECAETRPAWCPDLPLKAKSEGIRKRYWK